MEAKLPEEQVKSVLAPWRFSLQSSGFEKRLLAAMELYDRFPLDIAVTGGTWAANARLAAVVCGLGGEQEAQEDEDEEDSDGETEEEDDSEEDEEEVNDDSAGKAARVPSPSKAYGRIPGHADDKSKEEGSDSAPMYLHPRAANVRIWTVKVGSAPVRDNYDVLVVLTTALHQEEHLRVTMEQCEKDKPLYLVRAEHEWDLVLEKPSGPCKTCEWERMRARSLELQKKQKLVEKSEDRHLPDVDKLLELEEIAEVLNKAFPELRKKAFSQFLVDITRELRVPKTPNSGTIPLVNNALKLGKISQEDLNQISVVFQPRDVTDHPSKLLSVLSALEHFRLDVGLVGQTGCGSSSLFNSLLGLPNGDNNVVSTGVTETTQEPVAGPYPELSNVLLWDLPGWGRVGDLKKEQSDGSSSSQQDPSLPLPNLPVCDVYILVSPLRLSLSYIQLWQHLLSQGRVCYLVISKADLIDEKSAGEVRRWTEEVLGRLGLEQNVFLVSALHPETMDFYKLREVMKTTLPSLKRAAMASYVAKLLEQDVFWKRADPCKVM